MSSGFLAPIQDDKIRSAILAKIDVEQDRQAIMNLMRAGRRGFPR